MVNLPEINFYNITDIPSNCLGNTLRIQIKSKNVAGLYISSEIGNVVSADIPSTPT